jgi:YD repeat-containing protein
MSPNPSTHRRYHPRSTFVIALIIVSLLISVVPQPAPVQAASPTAPSSIPSSQVNEPPLQRETGGDDQFPPSVIGRPMHDQATTERTAYSRTERNPDGSYTALFSVRPMHWQDAQTGNWKEFVNDLRPATDTAYAYENSANGYRALFGKAPDITLGRPALRVVAGGAAITMVAVGASPKDASVSGAQLIYANAYPATELRYTLDNERVKEDIILKQAPANAAATTYTFDLSLEGLTAAQQADRSINFTNANGATIFRMPAPFMVDSNPQSAHYSDAVQATLTQLGGGKLRLEITPDLAWLQDPARVYPVVLDPTTEWVVPQPKGTVAQNTTIWQDAPSTNTALYDRLYAGKNASGARRDILIQFPEVNTLLPKDSMIVRAQLELYADSGTNGLPMEVHHNTSSWNDETVTWNTAPGMDSHVWSTPTANVTSWTRFFISELVRAWHRGTQPNHGVRILSTGSADQQVPFYSSHATRDQPKLWVRYVPATRVGLSQLWQYTTYDHGGGNTSQINISTGNHVFQHQGGSIAARGFDVDLTHTYNIQDPYGQTDKYYRAGAYYGEGWTFSHNLRLYEIDSGWGVVFKDGTGAHRVYAKTADVNGTREYARQLYYDMKLTKNLSSTTDPYKIYTLTPDSGGRPMYFDAGGKLRRIEDRNGNYLSYAYDTDSSSVSDPNGRLTSITDVAGRKTELVYAGPGGRLSKITDMANRVSTYEYDGDGNLVAITHGVGSGSAATTKLDYAAANLLTTITTPNTSMTTAPKSSQRFHYYMHSWEPADTGAGSTEGWAAYGNTTISQATDRAFHGSASLKLNMSNISNTTAGGAARTITTPESWNSIQQDLLAWMYVPSGYQLYGRLVLTDAQGRTQFGPWILVNGGGWTTVTLPAARIDPAFKIQKVSFEVTTPSGAANYTGAVWLDLLMVRGLTSRLRDAKDAHNLIAWHRVRARVVSEF